MPGAPGLCFSFLIHRPCSFCRGGQWKQECFTVVIATRPARAPKAPDEVVYANQASTVASPAINPPNAQASCSAAGVSSSVGSKLGVVGRRGWKGEFGVRRVYRVCAWRLVASGLFQVTEGVHNWKSGTLLGVSRCGLAVRR